MQGKQSYAFMVVSDESGVILSLASIKSSDIPQTVR